MFPGYTKLLTDQQIQRIHEASLEILKLAYAAAGSEQAYKDHPFITHHCCPIISPLKMDENSTESVAVLAGSRSADPRGICGSGDR